MTQGFAGLFHVFRRDAQMAREIGEACVDLCAGKGLAYWLEAGVFCRGWALAEEGQTEAGIGLMRQGIAGYRMTGEIAHTQRLADLARICGTAGRTEDGLALLDDALEAVRRNEEHFYEAEIHRLRGDLLLLQGADEAQAETYLQRAIELAQQQSARMWELRATASLCRLWQRQGKRRKARKRLARIYDWFSEGFDTLDLQEARALLEELA
jgi:tetratricopeptide (TPR) repeat protein